MEIAIFLGLALVAVAINNKDSSAEDEAYYKKKKEAEKARARYWLSKPESKTETKEKSYENLDI